MIDTDALKKKVLDLAIEGKLTRDFETENNIEELHQLLISENKKKKDIVPVSEDEHEGITIPNEWKWVRLGEISSIYGGKRIPAGRKLTTEDTGHKYIRVSEMKNGTVLTDNLLFVPEDIYPSISKYVIGKDDIYITVAGTIGCVGKIPEEIDGANLTENADKIVFSYIDKDWLIYCLSASVVQKQIYMSTTQVAQPKLAIKRIEELAIPLPNISEQKRIARIILEMNQLIDKIDILQTQYYSNLEVLKSKIIDAGIQGKLTEQLPEDGTAEELLKQIAEEKKMYVKEGKIKASKSLPEITDDEIPFEIPDNWKWCRLVDLCKEITDGTHKTPTYIETGVPFLSVKNVSSGHFDFEDVKYISESEHRELIKRCNPEKGDILICRIGTLGKAIEIDINVDFSIFVSLGLIKPLNSYLSKYLVYVLNSGFGEKWIKKNKAGDAMHAAKINLDVLRSFLVPLPPLLEQTRIVDKIDEMLSIVQR